MTNRKTELVSRRSTVASMVTDLGFLGFCFVLVGRVEERAEAFDDFAEHDVVGDTLSAYLLRCPLRSQFVILKGELLRHLKSQIAISSA
jgi:hypothetical protein